MNLSTFLIDRFLIKTAILVNEFFWEFQIVVSLVIYFLFLIFFTNLFLLN